MALSSIYFSVTLQTQMALLLKKQYEFYSKDSFFKIIQFSSLNTDSAVFKIFQFYFMKTDDAVFNLFQFSNTTTDGTDLTLNSSSPDILLKTLLQSHLYVHKTKGSKYKIAASASVRLNMRLTDTTQRALYSLRHAISSSFVVDCGQENDRTF